MVLVMFITKSLLKTGHFWGPINTFYAGSIKIIIHCVFSIRLTECNGAVCLTTIDFHLLHYYAILCIIMHNSLVGSDRYDTAYD